MTKTTTKTGFTLIEVLVAITLLVLVMGLIIMPLMSSFGYLEKGLARSEAQVTARAAQGQMVREMAEAMYVFDNTSNRSMIAFVTPNVDTICAEGGEIYHYYRTNCPNHPGSAVTHRVIQPLEPMKMDVDGDGTPEAVAIRYWLVPRDPALPAENIRMVARTVIPNPWTQDVIGLPRAMDAAWPNPSGGRAYLDQISAITPKSANFNIPLLSFTPERVVADVLRARAGGSGEPDFAVYEADFPLWEGGFVVKVYDPAGADVTASRTFTIDENAGLVRFAQAATDALTIAVPVGGTLGVVTCTHLPLLSGSETVVVNGVTGGSRPVTVTNRTYLRVGGDPQMGQYRITYPTGVLEFPANHAGMTATVTYSWRDNLDTDRVVADYSTRAAQTIALTVSRVDRGGFGARAEDLVQTFHATDRVVLKNVPR